MKKTVKPSPVAVLLFGTLNVICIGLLIMLLSEENGDLAAVAFPVLLLVGVFVFYLFRYLGQSRIEFDESTFTVEGETYRYKEITDVTVDSEQVLSRMSTLRITLYKGEEEICDFTKADIGAKEFIAVMKKHRVSISIDV